MQVRRRGRGVMGEGRRSRVDHEGEGEVMQGIGKGLGEGRSVRRDGGEREKDGM